MNARQSRSQTRSRSLQAPSQRGIGLVATVSLVAIGVLIVVSLFAPLVSAYDPLAQDAEVRLQAPSRAHLFGTDGFGRDVLIRVLYGTRVSLTVAFGAVATAAVVGALSGIVSSYVGGTADLLYQRFVDLLIGFPSIVLSIVIVVAMNPSPLAIGIAISVTLMPRIARIARAASLSVSEKPYVLAARSLGLGAFRIAVRHILPNVTSAILAQVSTYFGAAIVAEATMSFLGLGVPPPYPSLGRMLQEGSRQYFEVAPWVTVFPGLVIAVSVICFALVGDALSDRGLAGRSPRQVSLYDS